MVRRKALDAGVREGVLIGVVHLRLVGRDGTVHIERRPHGGEVVVWHDEVVVRHVQRTNPVSEAEHPSVVAVLEHEHARSAGVMPADSIFERTKRSMALPDQTESATSGIVGDCTG